MVNIAGVRARMGEWLKLNTSAPWLHEENMLASMKALVGLNSILMVLVIVTNGIFLIILIRKDSLHTAPNTLLGALCLSDLLVGLVLVPVWIAHLARFTQQQFSLYLFLSQIFLLHMLTGLSFTYMAMICCERYFAICHPFKYVKYATPALAVKASGLAFFSVFLITCISVFFLLKGTHIILFINETIISAAAFLVVIICNYKVFKVIRKHNTQIMAIANQTTADHQNTLNREGERQRTNLVVILFVVFFVSYLPSIFMPHYGISNYHWKLNSQRMIAFMWIDFLKCLNSLTNPLIYCYRLRSIRTAVIETICHIKRVLFRM